ncbi:hypothetical protein NG899_10095 [Acidovorax kalamii]|nr:hypothetical protein [Acidovorax kalamii]
MQDSKEQPPGGGIGEVVWHKVGAHSHEQQLPGVIWEEWLPAGFSCDPALQQEGGDDHEQATDDRQEPGLGEHLLLNKEPPALVSIGLKTKKA